MQVPQYEVAKVWADVIGVPVVDVHTNFFDLGGHSLLLMELVTELSIRLAIDADIVMVLEHPTVATFTSHWNALQSGEMKQV